MNQYWRIVHPIHQQLGHVHYGSIDIWTVRVGSCELGILKGDVACFECLVEGSLVMANSLV
jgi:hypothetical protein